MIDYNTKNTQVFLLHQVYDKRCGVLCLVRNSKYKISSNIDKAVCPDSGIRPYMLDTVAWIFTDMLPMCCPPGNLIAELAVAGYNECTARR